MSSDTRQRILDTARDLFNTQGLSRVGVRDVARAVDMSPGNLAYHFPTKDALVTALVEELQQTNARAIFSVLPDDFSPRDLYVAAVGAMRNMLAYRFVLLSYADAVAASPELRRNAQAYAEARRRRTEALLALLVHGGWIDGRAIRPRVGWLHEQSEMISSGWLSAAKLRPELAGDDEKAVLYFAKVGCALLEPFCTAKGRRQMKRVLAGDFDAGTFWRDARQIR